MRDLETGVVTLVSHNAAGTDAANGGSLEPVFSPDGTKVAFRSEGTNFGPPVSRLPFIYTDIYVRDLTTDAITLVSADADGTDGGDGASFSPVFSPDGTRIAYESTSTNLGPNDPSAAGDIYLYDIAGGTTSLVSADATGARSGNSVSVEPRFSADGTRIAFRSAASNLGPTDTNICPSAFISGPCHDVYVRDLSSGTTLLASVNASGTNAGDADSGARGWDFSADGTKVVFTSDATNLGPANAAGQIFLRDLEAGTTSLVTVASDGATSAGSSIQPVFSPDDRKVAFLSTAADLGPADTNGVLDLYERDLVFNASSLVSANEAGDDSGNGPVGSFAYRPDGTRIAYVTAASDHGEVDTNGVDDVYVAAPRPAG